MKSFRFSYILYFDFTLFYAEFHSLLRQINEVALFYAKYNVDSMVLCLHYFCVGEYYCNYDRNYVLNLKSNDNSLPVL